MGSCLDENYSTINNQISSGSRSSLLLSHVEFEANGDDEDDLMSQKTLQSKYNVLTNDGNNGLFANNVVNNDTIKLNGQLSGKLSANTSPVTNGNSCNDSTGNDGLVAPKQVLFPRERILLEWKEPHKIGSGLTNLGNTCFLNSVLQCLSYSPPLVNYLLYTNDHMQNRCNQLNQNMFCMVCEMRQVVRQTRSSVDAVKPFNVCRRLKSIAKHFQLGRQEDAHEFLRYVVDNMWKSCLNYYNVQHQKLDPKSKETTAINQIFGGYHRSQVICLSCNAKSNTYDYFMDFMLDIKNVSTLEKALEKFTAPEILQSENAYKCTRCKRKVLARKQFTIYSAPNVATFQFKRFDYNRIFGGKITKPVTYPERLNLRPYMSEAKGPPINYKLSSVLVHLGPTCNSGHYFCYVRNSNNFWYLMDDSRTVQVNQNQALSQQAYVLFYVRVDTDFHKPAPVINGIKIKPALGLSPELQRPDHNRLEAFKNRQNNAPTTIPVRKPVIPPMNAPQTPPDPSKSGQNQLKRKQNSTSKSMNNTVNNNNSNHITKGLVPYASDSSDEDSPKPPASAANAAASSVNHSSPATLHMNGGLNNNNNNNSFCDKSINNSNNRFSLSTTAANNLGDLSDKCPQKSMKLENISIKIKTNANQIIPNPKQNKGFANNSNNNKHLNNNLQNHTSESVASNCVPLAPITLKVKATTSSWHVVESCALRSPSITSNSSTNSVNSTTNEWSVSDCKPEFSGTPRSKHKHRNGKHQTPNGCPAIVNGTVSTPVSSAKHRLSQSEPNSGKTAQSPSNMFSSAVLSAVNTSAQLSVNHLKDNFDDRSYSNKSVTDSPPKRLSPKKLDSRQSENSNSFAESSADSHQRRDSHFDRRSISSHRSSNDSTNDHKMSKKHDRSHSKSANNSDADDDKNTGSHHKHEKRKKRKHSADERRLSSGSDDSSSDEKKHKKKKKKKNKKSKKKKHKKRDHSSGSESDADSDANQLQWIERTKETVEKERDITAVSKPEPYVRKWDENVYDLAKKKRIDGAGDAPNHLNLMPPKAPIEANDVHNDAVNGLLKDSHRGFGDKVNSWTGGPSTLDTSIGGEKRFVNDFDDEDYNEEFDRGKTKKVKLKHNEKYQHQMNGNPFQKIASEKHRFNGDFNRNHNNNSNHKDLDKSWDKSYHKQRYDHHNSERRH